MFSYWEQQSFLKYDHIIIGAGITGLSTAIEIKNHFPQESVLVLERGFFPDGASTRNAGFACMGSLTELLDDLDAMDEDRMCRLFELRKSGLDMLRKRLGDAQIGYAERGSYELISEAEKEAIDKMSYLNSLLLPITSKNAFQLVNEKIKTFGFSPKYTQALIRNNCEGELNSGKMMKALLAFASQQGVEVRTGITVSECNDSGKEVTVTFQLPTNAEPVAIRSRTLCICTNAFTPSLLPEENITPGRGQVLITKPIVGLRFTGVYHFDKGYYYFREIDGRILFGGGRNLDYDGEKTFEKGLNERIQKDLEEKLRTIILPDMPFEIDMRWSGIMAFGPDKFPLIKQVSNNVFGAFRMGGMGVALGSKAGADLAQLVAQQLG